ncbi:PREDICTED: zinc finger BED domain-containing protein RICESLEEPER 1-like [Ipomoea nil]|uniref:zinc finger BED domain-containing protein RICESLEEPER 1-like n=1 Tax=Ipomoea nil TaxID=35883 RepID=UPI0009013CF3|nr:PREDICTED: zinc finger BED domain-containing protein RICESLEEPER 1-like [Ipomoea nil]
MRAEAAAGKAKQLETASSPTQFVVVAESTSRSEKGETRKQQQHPRMASNNTNESTPEEVNVQVTTTTPSISSSQPIESNNSEEVNRVENDSILTKKRKKTSQVWKDFDEIVLANGTKKAVCLYCKEKYSTGGKGGSTSHLKRHSEICLQRKLHISRENKQTTIQFCPPSESGDARLKSFHEVVELKGLKERKLILDCPTRWNSTFLMLSTASKFKHAFSDYNEKEPHYKYAPSFEDWDKIEKVCKLLEVFNDATHVISVKMLLLLVDIVKSMLKATLWLMVDNKWIKGCKKY